MPPGSIQRMRWIKPAYRWAPDQTCGHVILTVTKPDIANTVLTSGLVICQKQVYAEKCKKEPTRCLKCHGWGHLSYSCPQASDTCGTCAGQHRTADCTYQGRPRCVSCKMEGHASWDRQCPTFVRKCEEMNSRLSENSMPYFPTGESWTHISQLPKPVYHMPTPMPPNAGQPPGVQRGAYWQTTLHFPTSQRQAGSQQGPRAHSGSSPVTGANGVEAERPRRWGDRDGDKGLLPPSCPPDV